MNTLTQPISKEITHVVSFSGGRSSALLVWLMLMARKKLGWRVMFIFCDTGAECPSTYKFIRDMIKFWNLWDLVILRADINPTLGQGNGYKVFEPKDLMNTAVMPPLEPFLSLMKKYSTPSIAAPFCSERMKKNVFDAYCKDHIGEHITWLGMRSDEPKRLKRHFGIKYLADLIEADKQDVLDWWKTQPFDLNAEEYETNCIFCPKKSTAKLAMAMRDNPGQTRMWKYRLKDKEIRVKEGHDPMAMYRGKLTIDNVATLYADFSDDELKSKLKLLKGRDFGECSESCEPISVGNVDFGEIGSALRDEFESAFNLNQQLLF